LRVAVRRLSARPSAVGGWHLFVDELANVAIRPVPRFVGGADVTLELRRAGLTIDRRALHFVDRRLTASGVSSRVVASHPRFPVFREFLQWLSKRSGAKIDAAQIR
jgi:hypothetical protein